MRLDRPRPQPRTQLLTGLTALLAVAECAQQTNYPGCRGCGSAGKVYGHRSQLISAVYAQADNGRVPGELFKLRIALRPSLAQHVPGENVATAAVTVDSSNSSSGHDVEGKDIGESHGQHPRSRAVKRCGKQRRKVPRLTAKESRELRSIAGHQAPPITARRMESAGAQTASRRRQNAEYGGRPKTRVRRKGDEGAPDSDGKQENASQMTIERLRTSTGNGYLQKQKLACVRVQQQDPVMAAQLSKQGTRNLSRAAVSLRQSPTTARSDRQSMRVRAPLTQWTYRGPRGADAQPCQLGSPVRRDALG